MEDPTDKLTARRRLLKFLALSPLAGGLGLPVWPAPPPPAARRDPDAAGEPFELEETLGELIASADEALNVFDFRAVARRNMPPAHYGYLATGVDGNGTLRENRRAFSRLYLRPRRLVDVTKVDTGVTLFGERWETPIILAPAGSQAAFHEEAELGAARAARAKHHLQILSTVSSTPVEDVVEARGGPVWYQLYPTSRWDIAKTLLARVEAAGCPVVVLTVDMPVLNNREMQSRYKRIDTRDCSQCHSPDPDDWVRGKPMYRGTGIAGLDEFFAAGLTWDFVARLRDMVPGTLILKGIVTSEDAKRSLEYGVDGLIVSNHGGRAEESGRATIDTLPEVVEAVRGRMPVLVDSGIRRGTDIFKALALGADAICIGRPYLWGLGAFGQAGVEKVLGLLRAELEIVMKFAGTTSLAAIGPSYVGRHPGRTERR